MINKSLTADVFNAGNTAASNNSARFSLKKLNSAKSIYAKLTVVFTLLVVLTGSGVLYLGYQSMRDYYQEITQELNKSIAMYMADNYQLDTNDLEKSRHELVKISQRAGVLNPSIEIYLLNANGNVLEHNQTANSIVNKQVDLTAINSFLAPEQYFPLRGTDPKNDKVKKIFSVSALKLNGRIQGYVYVILGGQLFDDIGANIRSSYVLQTSFSAALLIVLTTLIIGLIAFKVITARLAVLSKAMLEFSCEAPCTVKLATSLSSSDEIDLLTQNFSELTAKLEEQFNRLKQADQQHHELVSNVSHDLRTPLAITKGYIDTLCIKNQQLSESERLYYLQVTQRSNEQLATLIDDLFELSKFEAGNICLNCEPFSILELIYDTVQEFEIIAAQKSITICVPSPTLAKKVLVNADIALIQRVFANLIANALKFTPEQGSVSIDLSIEDNCIKVSVKDTGCGIAPEDIPYIFERHYFKTRLNKAEANSLINEDENADEGVVQPLSGSLDFEVDQQEKRSDLGGSSGLGLAIVKKILELHNTNIQVSNLAKRGSHFHFILPTSM